MISATVSQSLKKRLDEEVKLDQNEISKGAEVVNEVVQTLLEKLKYDPFFKSMPAEKVNTGSNYEGLKVARPDEYDVMLTFDVMDPPKIEPVSSVFPEGGPDSRYVMIEDGYLATRGLFAVSPVAFKQEFHRVVCDLANTLRNKNVKIKVDPPTGGPNILVKIHRSGRIYDMDLVPALAGIKLSVITGNNLPRILPWMTSAQRKEAGNEWCFLVAKQWKGGCFLRYTVWRLSFSLVEKMIIKPLPVDMKSALRLLKSDLEKWKEEGDSGWRWSVSSYHLKTLLLNYLNDRRRSDWDKISLDEMYAILRSSFTNALYSGRLLHYFLPDINLLENLQLSEKQYLLERIDATNTRPVPRTQLSQQRFRFRPY